MELNYTPLYHTPLNIEALFRFHEQKKKKKGLDGIFLSLSLITIMTLATIIYTLIERKFITGL